MISLLRYYFTLRITLLCFLLIISLTPFHYFITSFLHAFAIFASFSLTFSPFLDAIDGCRRHYFALWCFLLSRFFIRCWHMPLPILPLFSPALSLYCRAAIFAAYFFASFSIHYSVIFALWLRQLLLLIFFIYISLMYYADRCHFLRHLRRWCLSLRHYHFASRAMPLRAFWYAPLYYIYCLSLRHYHYFSVIVTAIYHTHWYLIISFSHFLRHCYVITIDCHFRHYYTSRQAFSLRRHLRRLIAAGCITTDFFYARPPLRFHYAISIMSFHGFRYAIDTPPLIGFVIGFFFLYVIITPPLMSFRHWLRRHWLFRRHNAFAYAAIADLLSSLAITAWPLVIFIMITLLVVIFIISHYFHWLCFHFLLTPPLAISLIISFSLRFPSPFHFHYFRFLIGLSRLILLNIFSLSTLFRWCSRHVSCHYFIFFIIFSLFSYFFHYARYYYGHYYFITPLRFHHWSLFSLLFSFHIRRHYAFIIDIISFIFVISYWYLILLSAFHFHYFFFIFIFISRHLLLIIIISPFHFTPLPNITHYWCFRHAIGISPLLFLHFHYTWLLSHYFFIFITDDYAIFAMLLSHALHYLITPLITPFGCHCWLSDAAFTLLITSATPLDADIIITPFINNITPLLLILRLPLHYY